MCDILNRIAELKVDEDDVESRQDITNQLIACMLMDTIYPDPKVRARVFKEVRKEAIEMVEKYEMRELIKSA